jgi:hypothetical protein
MAEAEYIDDDEAEKPEQDSDRLQEVWETALTEFDAVALPQIEMRAQSLEARRFVTVPGAMWEGPWGYQWENSPRPEVDKITKSLEKIETDYRENRLTINFLPADQVADTETADMLDGLQRADAYHFKSIQAYDNAFQEAIRGGFGAWRLTTEYSDPLDPDDDTQRVNPGVAIVDADQSVYFYGGILYDKSDAESAFILTRELRGIAVKKWGADNLVPWPDNRWKYVWDWYTPDVVCIAEYYKCEIRKEKRLTFTNKLTEEAQRYWNSEIDADEVADLEAQGWMLTTRMVKRKRVRKYIINGTKVLKDCGYIAFDMIPIVPVYGRRDWVDNMERWRGHVGKKMDRQRIYNASVAKVVETQSLAPYEVPILFAEQLAGYATGPDGQQSSLAELWARGNIDRTPFRLILPMYNPDGSLAAAGPVGKIEPPQVQPATAALLQISSSDLTDDDQNADEVKANVSADAMDIAATRVDAKSAIYLDNMRQSMQRGAEIYQSGARAVYCEPGRKVDTLTADEKEGVATLAEPILDDQGVYKIRNDLTQGRYKVVASVQESTATKQQKTVKQSLALAQAFTEAQSPKDALAALYTAAQNMDGEGIRELQKFYRSQGIQIGSTEPNDEEKKQLEQAAAQQQQAPPDPAQEALTAQAKKFVSEAELNEAKRVETLASAQLKDAQAQVVGGPASEPEKPSGLTDVDRIEKLANVDLKTAQAAKLRNDVRLDRVRTPHQMDLERRQQDHAERQKAANE